MITKVYKISIAMYGEFRTLHDWAHFACEGQEAMQIEDGKFAVKREPGIGSGPIVSRLFTAVADRTEITSFSSRAPTPCSPQITRFTQGYPQLSIENNSFFTLTQKTVTGRVSVKQSS